MQTASAEVGIPRSARSKRVGGRARRIASWTHFLLVLAVALGVVVQVYLIGSYIFGAGQDALDAHRSAGFTLHALEIVVFLAALAAWLRPSDIVLSALLPLLGTVQIALTDGDRWVGGLHALGALLVLALAALLAWRHIPRLGFRPLSRS